jgi:hypothetical protein
MLSKKQMSCLKDIFLSLEKSFGLLRARRRNFKLLMRFLTDSRAARLERQFFFHFVPSGFYLTVASTLCKPLNLLTVLKLLENCIKY